MTPRECLRATLIKARADAQLTRAAFDASPPEPQDEHPAPWWYRLAARVLPERVREIPESLDPGRVLLRQLAIVRRSVYLQGFASGEDARWLHSHQWRWTIVLGLWGSYTERRMAGSERRRRAPYVTVMSADVVHQVTDPSPGHTSLLVGLRRDDSMRKYFPAGIGRHWSVHVRRLVRRDV